MSRVNSPTIYFMQAGSPSDPIKTVKIGYTSRRTQERAAEGQTFHAEEILVLAETYGTRKDEAALHRRFKHLRVRGEMFRYGPEIQELVCHLLEGHSLQSWLE